MIRLWRGAPTIAAAMAGPTDNFALIRLGLALAVVVSHAFSVTTGAPGEEPLVRSTGFSLGEHAVNGFFAVSGFLVTMSYDRRGPRDYALARFLRIAPGFVAAVLAVALLLGPALTRLPTPEYLASPGLWRFVSATLGGFKSTATLPGLFEANPFRFPMGTVWTLKYEALCYGGVLALGLAGLLRSRPVALALVAGLAVTVAALDLLAPEAGKGVQTALRLPLLFAAGGALYLWRDQARLSGLALAALLLATVLLQGTFAYRATLFLAEAYGVIWLALAPGLPGLNPRADLSYGTYLYGWPIQQSLHQLWPASTALSLLGPAIALTLAAAAASWFLVEKPALGLKARLVGRPALTPVLPATPGRPR